MRDRAEDQITLALIRHGATRANKEHRYIGKTDEPLSEEGVCALLEKKAREMYPEAGLVFSSPMKRCIETAEILYPKKTPILIPEWKEMDFGAFEGKNYIDLKEDRRYQEWIDSGGTIPFPEGESREAFARRCETGLHRMIGLVVGQLKEEPQKTVCAVVHGGTIMALFGRYAKGDYFDYQVQNGEGYCCLLKYGRNHTPALPGGIWNVQIQEIRRI